MSSHGTVWACAGIMILHCISWRRAARKALTCKSSSWGILGNVFAYRDEEEIINQWATPD